MHFYNLSVHRQKILLLKSQNLSNEILEIRKELMWEAYRIEERLNKIIPPVEHPPGSLPLKYHTRMKKRRELRKQRKRFGRMLERKKRRKFRDQCERTDSMLEQMRRSINQRDSRRMENRVPKQMRGSDNQPPVSLCTSHHITTKKRLEMMDFFKNTQKMLDKRKPSISPEMNCGEDSEDSEDNTISR